MFNTPPSHGILSFRSLPKYPFEQDDVAPAKPYVKKSLPKTWNRKGHHNRKIPDI